MYINIGRNYNNNSFLSTWNFNIISDMINPRYSKIFLCLSISEYFILIKVFEIIVSLFYLVFLPPLLFIYIKELLFYKWINLKMKL